MGDDHDGCNSREELSAVRVANFLNCSGDSDVTTTRETTTSTITTIAPITGKQACAMVERRKPQPHTSEIESNSNAPQPLRIERVVCPALSLDHHGHLNLDHSSRKEAEESAAQLLSRNVVLEESVFQEGTNLMLMASELIRESVNKSFALLFDSRLRAYATSMARHGMIHQRSSEAENIAASSPLITELQEEKNPKTTKVNPQQQEQEEQQPRSSDEVVLWEKLFTLLHLGDILTASRMRTEFRAVSSQTGDRLARNLLLEEEEAECRHDIIFHASMDLFMDPSSCVAEDITAEHTMNATKLTVSYEAQGKLLVSRSKESASAVRIQITLDTHKLLSGMIEEASRVVARIIEWTNLMFGAADQSVRSARDAESEDEEEDEERNSDEANSKNNEIASQCSKRKLDDVSSSMRVMVISPEMTSSPQDLPTRGECNHIPPLDLSQLSGSAISKNEEDDDELSADQCANIVDDIFVDVDSSIFSPQKKTKISF